MAHEMKMNMERELYQAMRERPETPAPSTVQKRVPVPAQFDNEGKQTVASMKYGRIDPEYLTKLIMEHKDNIAKHGKGYPVGNDLAMAIRLVIKKTAGDTRWRNYTDDWKEEMFGYAEILALKYVHNFNPDRMKDNSKNKDPYYYIGRIVTNAFIQKLEELKKHSKYVQFTSLNENLLSSCTMMDQYAGVVAEAKQAAKESKMGEIGLNGGNMDSLIDSIDDDE